MLGSSASSNQAHEIDIAEQEAEHTEREGIKRSLFLMYCGSKSKTLDNPTVDNPRVDTLWKIFDDFSQNYADQIPAHIVNHLNIFPSAINTQTTKLWIYTLASYIQYWILDPPSIKKDLLDALGSNRLEAIRQCAAGDKSIDSKLIENALVYAYFRLLYKLIQSTQFAHPFKSLYEKYIQPEDFTNANILVKRKHALLEQLNLCLDCDEHLAFWQRFVDPGLLGTGGTAVREYRIPSHIYTLMTNARPNTTEPYAHFKVRMDALRHSPSFFSFGRTSFSQVFYDFDDDKIERMSVRTIASRLSI